jgi:alanine dehydrogenase
MGADVTIIDIDQRKLAYMDDLYGNRLTTLMSNRENIRESIVRSHLVIGSVLITGARAPRLVTADMVRQMKSGSVIVDVAIDQGGCIETSRPTTHKEPTYTVNEVIHYCVPNMPGVVARTSTYALTNMTLPYALKLANLGFQDAVRADPALALGVNCVQGKITYKNVADALGYAYTSLHEFI